MSPKKNLPCVKEEKPKGKTTMALAKKTLVVTAPLSLSEIMRQELKKNDIPTKQMRNIVENKYGVKNYNEGSFNVILSTIRKELGYASRFQKRNKVSEDVVRVAKTLTKKYGKKQLLKIVTNLDNATRGVGLSKLRVFLENLDKA